MDREFPKQVTLKDGTTALIRKAVPDDAECLLKLFNETVKDDRYVLTTIEDVKEMQMTVEKEVEWIKNHDKDGSVVLVGQVGESIAGLVGFENGNRKRNSHTSELHISVLKQYRGVGLGKALIDNALQWARRDPLIEKVCLCVFADNDRAISLYEKIGFVEEGRKVREIKRSPNDYVDIILMYKFVK